MAGGLLVTVLLVAYLISMKNNAAEIERLAAQLTKSNEDLEREITKRALAVEEIRRLALALATASDGVLITGMDGRISFVNRAAEKMLGYASGVMLGMNALDIYPESLRETTETTAREIFEATRNEGSWTGEVSFPSKAGEELRVRLSTALMKGDEGHLLGMVGIATDVTERRQL